ncbi:hypothetical protein Asp14428_34890 [Actinoplanes sp. NBRC 14428]|nr:hypothetical protein Asp14428_34890 [Actinoplanes sp. NBRC 14428]
MPGRWRHHVSARAAPVDARQEVDAVAVPEGGEPEVPAAAARADLGAGRQGAVEEVTQAVPAGRGVDVGNVHDYARTQADVGFRPA